MIMYNSLKKWANIPIQVHPYISTLPSLDKEYDTAIDALCYPVGKLNTVVDREGKEVISSNTLYVDADKYTIYEEDLITYMGRDHEIKSLRDFFRNGKRDIWVVYI